MKPGAKPTVEQYLSKANRVDMNVVGVQQGWMKIQERVESQRDALPMSWTPLAPKDVQVLDAHRKNWEGRQGSATFEPGDSVIEK